MGSIYSLDAELLEELEPDLIPPPGLCDICAVFLDVVEQAAAELSKTLCALSMNSTSMNEVLDVTIEIGEAVGRGTEARRKMGALQGRLDQAEQTVARLPRLLHRVARPAVLRRPLGRVTRHEIANRALVNLEVEDF